MRNYQDLDVWKKSIEYVTEIYRMTNCFPDSEKFGLTNQMRRAAISIPSNIAEGASRQYDKEYIQFVYVSLGSLNELNTQLIIASNLKYIDAVTNANMLEVSDNIGKMLSGLIKYLKSKT